MGSARGVRYVGVRPTDLEVADDDARTERIRHLCNDHGISLGLHTLSAVNTAEFTPLIEEAVREYLFAFVDIAAAVGADRTIVHAGYHFTSNEDACRETSLNRLEELLAYAEEGGVTILLENMNPEPADAEVHYLCSELEDVRRYFDRLSSPNLRWRSIHRTLTATKRASTASSTR